MIPKTCGDCALRKIVTEHGGHHPGSWSTCSHELAARRVTETGWAVHSEGSPPEWCPLRTSEMAKDAVGAVIRQVRREEQPDDAGYCAYNIVIDTDKGALRISGCHGMGPDFAWTSKESDEKEPMIRPD